MSTEVKGLNWYTWTAIFAAFAAMVVLYSFYPSDEREEALETLDSIAELQHEVLENSTNEAGALAINDVPIEQTSDATGEIGKLELLLRGLTQTEVGLTNEFMREMNSAGFQELFVPEILRQEGGAAKSLENITILKKTVEKHRARYFEFYDGIPNVARESDMLETTQSQFIKGYREAYEAKHRLFSKRWDFQLEILDIYSGMLKVLEADSGKWSIEGGQMLFYDDSLREMYNTQFEALTQLKADQVKLQQEMNALNQNAIERTKSKL